MKFTLTALLGFICLNLSVAQVPEKEVFSNPPIKFWPRPLWFWNNTTVTEDEIESQMRAFRDSCGYGGFGILPFGKKFQPEYLSDDYFRVYGKALETAKQLGLTMCLYDEFGFPSGGAGAVNGDDKPRFAIKYPDQTIKRLDKIEKETEGPSLFEDKLPGGFLMGVVAMETGTLKRIDLTGNVSRGKLKWNVPEGKWKVLFFVCVKDGDPIVDYLSPAAVRNFIDMTHDAYYKRFKDHFGTTISGTFFDEPTMYRASGRMWTENFNKEFEKKYGFSPVKWYPSLWYDIGPETQSARNHLFGFRTELYARGFTKEVNDWSVSHGITATGHQDQEEIQNPVSVSGDLMKCFKYLEIPGVDKIGGNRPAEKYYKIISSAAINWDRPYVMSETYGAMGDLSWNEIYSVAMDQYAKGINILIPHAVWYDDQHVTFKPELSHRNPLYADSLKSFNLFLSRLNVMLQNDGRPVADIAVLYPVSTLQGEHHFDGPLGYYKGGVEIPKTDYVEVAEWLTNWAGKDYTFIHPEVLDEKCGVVQNRLQLRNKINRQEYSVLIVPSCRTISVTNLQKIKSFYDQGGIVIFTTQLPSRSVEPGEDAAVKALVNSIFKEKKETQENNRGGKAFFIETPDGDKLRSALDTKGLTFDVDYPANPGLRCLHKIVGGKDLYYFANTGSAPVSTTLTLRGRLNPELWDPHTGTFASPVIVNKTDGSREVTVIELKLKPYHSCFLVNR